jgi:hypothetical protein
MNRPSENKPTPMKLEAETRQNEKINRRSLVRRGVKAAYVVPAVLAAIKATENPVMAQSGPVM